MSENCMRIGGQKENIMADWYTVECRGEARELFAVEADSPEEAMKNWFNGDSFLIECSSMEPVSVTKDE